MEKAKQQQQQRALTAFFKPIASKSHSSSGGGSSSYFGGATTEGGRSGRGGEQVVERSSSRAHQEQQQKQQHRSRSHTLATIRSPAPAVGATSPLAPPLPSPSSSPAVATTTTAGSRSPSMPGSPTTRSRSKQQVQQQQQRQQTEVVEKTPETTTTPLRSSSSRRLTKDAHAGSTSSAASPSAASPRRQQLPRRRRRAQDEDATAVTKGEEEELSHNGDEKHEQADSVMKADTDDTSGGVHGSPSAKRQRADSDPPLNKERREELPRVTTSTIVPTNEEVEVEVGAVEADAEDGAQVKDENKEQQSESESEDERDGLSAYELERLANIQRNRQVLDQLGVSWTVQVLHDQVAADKPKPAKRPKRHPTAVDELPVQRTYSLRTRTPAGGAAVTAAAAGGGAAGRRRTGEDEEEGSEGVEAAVPEPMAVVSFDDSAVLRYTLTRAADGEGGADVDDVAVRGGRHAKVSLWTDATGGAVTSGDLGRDEEMSGEPSPIGTLVQRYRDITVPRRVEHGGGHHAHAGREELSLDDPYLTRIYSIDFNRQFELLACGGHGGYVSVYGLRPLASHPRLLSFRAHKGWISGVQLISSPAARVGSSGSSDVGGAEGDSGETSADRPLLLTAGNDKMIALWDLSLASDSDVPKPLVQKSNLHSSGIFSVHARDQYVLTGSKDASVALSHLERKFEVVHRYQDHSSVVKCVRWRDHNVFASSGNDTLICLRDRRHGGGRSDPVLSMQGQHHTAINSHSFHPFDEHIMISASFDPTILVHDLRRPDTPVHRLIGHHHPSVTRCKGIYHPLFVDSGRAVVTSGDRSQHLSLYSLATGLAISRGEIGYDIQSMSVSNPVSGVLAVAHSNTISLLAPVYG